MNSVNLIYIIPLLLTLIIAVYLLIVGGNSVKKNYSKYFIFPIVLSIFGGTLLIDNYYQKQLSIEREKLNKLLQPTELNDSLFTDAKLRQQKIDRLEKENKELLVILSNLKNKEKVLGQQSRTISDIKNKVKSNDITIGAIERYNEILDKRLLEKRKGYTAYNNTSNFIFDCPTDYENNYLDLKLQFQDEKLVSKIEYIYISFTEKISDNRYNLLFDQVYKPQLGVNAFKVENYFKTGKQINLEVGYILKSEADRDYPRFERVVCKNY